MMKTMLKMEKDNGFYGNEIKRLDSEVRLDAKRADEYKSMFAETIRGLDKKEIMSATDLAPVRMKKPLKLRLREFWARLSDTLS